MNVSHELLASVGTLCLVVADEDSDGVDRESSEEGAALEAAYWCRGGEMVQLLLVGDGALRHGEHVVLVSRGGTCREGRSDDLLRAESPLAI